MIRRYLLDTGIAQDFQEGRHGVRSRADSERHLGHRIGICVPVLGELWVGIEGSASRDRNLLRLRRALSRLFVWPYSTEAAELRRRVQGWRPVGDFRTHPRKLGVVIAVSRRHAAAFQSMSAALLIRRRCQSSHWAMPFRNPRTKRA